VSPSRFNLPESLRYPKRESLLAVRELCFGVTGSLQLPLIQFVVPPKQPTDFDPLFWFLEWKKTERVGPRLANYIRVEESSGAAIHCAKLSFYKRFRLLRVTRSPVWQGAQPTKRRGYALFSTKKPEVLIPLDGTSLPIHKTNETPSELILSEETADEYLRFFCSAVHGDDGAFLMPNPKNYKKTQDVPLKSNPETKAMPGRENDSWLRPATDDEWKNLLTDRFDPFRESNIRPRIAWVIYSSKVFRAWFAISDSAKDPGIVQMFHDEPIAAPILALLNRNLPRYADGSLFIPRELP
jgi:hypothetical protein